MSHNEEQLKKIILRIRKDVDKILNYIEYEKALKAELKEYHKREVDKIYKK